MTTVMMMIRREGGWRGGGGRRQPSWVLGRLAFVNICKMLKTEIP